MVWDWGLAVGKPWSWVGKPGKPGLQWVNQGLAAPGASQQLLSEPLWEKKNQNSLQKPKNSKTAKLHYESVKVFLAFISVRTAWAEAFPSPFPLSPG